MFVSRWTVDYGDGPHLVVVPHAWAQEVSVEWEGPAVYRTELDVPRGGGTLRFHGVSYAAEVFLNGEFVMKHEGIWDAFDVPLPGGKVALEVRVTKNGGETYPWLSVASGGLPYLFHTFGGIYREVELLEPGDLPLAGRKGGGAPRPPVPYIRGVVHRGWFPDLGHPNPDEAIVRREIREIKALGFNLLKFAGWVPPHRYLDLLETEGMFAWLDLPDGGTILKSWRDPKARRDRTHRAAVPVSPERPRLDAARDTRHRIPERTSRTRRHDPGTHGCPSRHRRPARDHRRHRELRRSGGIAASGLP